MKKFVLFSILAAGCVSAFAREGRGPIGARSHKSTVPFTTRSAARTTAVGDTTILSHIGSGDTISYYSAGTDSGYITGTNAFGDKGFAERYDVVGTDSTIQVLGVVARFAGTVSPSTTKTINFKVWDVAPKSAFGSSTTIFNSGLPNTVLTSRVQNIGGLGIGAGTAPDTAKVFSFATPTAYLSKNFFIGYDINYTWSAMGGDTIALYNNLDGERTESIASFAPGDTVVNNVNVTMFDDGTWVDNAVANYGVSFNLYVFPIVKIGARTNLGASGIARNGFTFYGNYPNPCVNSTNVKFALGNATDVTVELMDMAGKIIATNNYSNLAAGEHTVSLSTADLAAGTYTYFVRTADGKGMASQLTVAK